MDDDLTLNEGQNDIILQAEGLQADFPYYMEARFYYEGYLNHFESTEWMAGNQTNSTMAVEIDVPGFVCDVTIYSYLYVRTPSGSNQLNYTTSEVNGPCDGSGSSSDAQLTIPLYALLNGTWTLVDDDTAIPPGTTEMYWDISMLDNETTVYFYQGGNYHWSGYVDGTDHPIEWEWEVSEFDCSPTSTAG